MLRRAGADEGLILSRGLLGIDEAEMVRNGDEKENWKYVEYGSEAEKGADLEINSW